MNKERLLIFGLLLMICSVSSASSQYLNVVTSFTVLADMVREVGGSQVSVRSLVGPNGDPHVYEPTPADSAALAKAGLVFISGLSLEGWMERLITASGYKGKVVVASDGIETRTMVDEEDGKTEKKEAEHIITDPHAWTSVANGIVYAMNIEKALSAADPANAKHYQTSGNHYISKLKKLDAWIQREMDAIPLAKRKVITNHESFGYLGDAYGIEFKAPTGFSTDAEPSAQQVAALIEQIRKEGIKAVFIENASDDRLVKQIARETGAKLGGILYPESLSEEGGPAANYIKMIQYNINTLKAGMLSN